MSFIPRPIDTTDRLGGQQLETPVDMPGTSTNTVPVIDSKHKIVRYVLWGGLGVGVLVITGLLIKKFSK